MFDFNLEKETNRAEVAGKKRGNLLVAQENKTEIIQKYGAEAYRQIEQEIENGADIGDILNHLQAKEKNRALVNTPPPIKGSAQWADWHELKNNNLLHDPDDKSTSSEVFFGAFINFDENLRKRADNWLYWNGQSHLMTVAPTGAGKSSLLLIPNLLQYDGSCLVFDPKGELYRSTSFFRSKIGKVYRLAPFEENTDAFNPLDQITSFDDALEFSEILYPRESSGDGAFYENEARSFLAALIYFISLIGKGADRTMAKVRYFMSLSTEPRITEDGKSGRSEFDTLLHKMATTESLPTAIQRSASLVLQFNAQVRTTLLRSLNEKLQIWDSEALERATRESSFKFEDMKKETVTIYLTVPFNRIEAYSYYVRAMLTFALEAMVADHTRPKKPVLFILDEFLRLGKFQRFIHALRTHRDAGVRLWFILQSIADMQESYPDNWKSFFTATEVKNFFGIRDHYTAQTISEMLGNYTHAYETTSTNSGLSSTISTEASNSANFGQSEQIHFEAKPLLDPNEIQRSLGTSEENGMRKGLVDIGGVNPIRTIMLPWYQGYRNHCRFGSKDNPLTPSPLLEHLWGNFNNDVFNGELEPLSDIGYQDFSMGRDGYMPFNQDFRGFYDGEFNRIILIDAIRPIEEFYYKVKKLNDPNAEKVKNIVFTYISPLLIHEMAHQLTEQRGGILNNHGSKFFESCKFAHRNNREKNLGFPWAEPTQDDCEFWPPFLKLAETSEFLSLIRL